MLTTQRHCIFLASILMSIPLAAAEQAPAAPGKSLAERLGYQATDRLLIINGDDAGMCHTANQATIDALENGLMTSATIMVPCPWFPEIAAYAKAHPQAGFGVHLTHTCEWKKYRWGPVSGRSVVPGLVDPDGYLWPDIMNVYLHATPEQAEIEARAQIKMALAAGIDITHLDSHMGTLQYDLRYYAVYRKLALEFDLPLRMGSQELLATMGAGNIRAELAAGGIVFPDYLIHGGRKKDEGVVDYWKRMLADLKPGVTELYIHAGLETEELQQITGSWKDRAAEHRLFTTDPEVRRLLDSQRVKRIGYRILRDFQRRERAAK